MWFHFHQNNSGGSFEYTDDLDENVLIEADTSAAADARLEALGGYFDGCESGQDCSCCGDRWSPSWSTPTETPSIYGEPVETFAGVFADGKTDNIVMHFADGRRVRPNEGCPFSIFRRR